MRGGYVHELVVGDVKPGTDLLVSAARALCILGLGRGSEADEVEETVGLHWLLDLFFLCPEGSRVLCKRSELNRCTGLGAG